jgi:hypothetical protein
VAIVNRAFFIFINVRLCKLTALFWNALYHCKRYLCKLRFLTALPALGANDAGSLRSSADAEIALEVTDFLRAEQPLRNAIAGKNVAVVDKFVPGSTDPLLCLAGLLSKKCSKKG